MSTGLDTNILVYAVGFGEPEKQQRADALLTSFRADNVVIPAQVLGEFYNVVTRKASWPAVRARAKVREWSDAFVIAETTVDTINEAASLSALHKLRVWDAVILAASRSAHCDTLLSEDMHEGFTWRGTTIVNPFVNIAWRPEP